MIDTKMERLRLGDVRLLPTGRNARFMRQEQFSLLVENVKRDGCLTSTPLGWYDEGPDTPPLILSGNHRVLAGIEALGADHVDDFKVTYDQLTKQQALALQLSHNAIEGDDDPAVLRGLYDELDSIDWREYTGLDDKTLRLLEDVKVDHFAEVNLDFQTLTIIFLPPELDRAKRAMDEAGPIAKAADVTWLAQFEQHDAMLESLDLAGKSYATTNVAVTLAVILALFERHLDELRDGWLTAEGEPKHAKWVPIATILGVGDMPADAAAILARAVQRMVDAGDVPDDTRWKALELLAADYLAGP